MEGLDGRLIRPSSATERVTASRQVVLTPSWLYSAVLVSDDAGRADAAIYDGHNTGEEVKVDITALDGDTKQLTFYPPLFMKKGIYVSVGSHVTSVVVQYSSVAE